MMDLREKFATISKKCKKQECIPVGCVPAARRPYAGVCFPGGCLLWEGLLRGVPGPGGCLVLGGVWSQGGVWSWGDGSGPGGVVSQHALRQTPLPLWTDRRL